MDPSALTPALAVAARRRGARIENHVDVRSLIRSGSRVTGVVAADGIRYRADWVVLAAGAWSTRITGLPFPDDWIGPCRGQIVVVRRGTPQPVVDRLHAAVVQAVQSPEVAQRYGDLGLTVAPSSQAEFAELIRSETARWGQVIREAHVTLD